VHVADERVAAGVRAVLGGRGLRHRTLSKEVVTGGYGST
jgi:hypothetical protein